MEKLENITINSCPVIRCKGEPKALIVAARDETVKMIAACERHDNGTYRAALMLGDDGFLVARYTELLRK